MLWRKEFRRHFASRAELELPALCMEFGLSPDQGGLLGSCLEVFLYEYGIEPGRLRPDDPLSLFINPEVTRNPLRWLFEQAAVEDKASELGYLLKKRRRAQGLPPMSTHPPKTIGEYVMAWSEKENRGAG